ncbi:hypothetical protein DAPPUDRAFT_267855 [Daphnia pulex]|uniref:Uncharacterized protein n=1 Tax=Daphnia pulex TaxID=6669 RepID=E9HX10_DAPPU|nr:hypothetical protein DAPPUDRAFT_267855 [Daphnia pulex]|eukprot:EFX63720.1 hypothetical protein DAPPUDRAFT_267855 [Daphnia pulex]
MDETFRRTYPNITIEEWEFVQEELQNKPIWVEEPVEAFSYYETSTATYPNMTQPTTTVHRVTKAINDSTEYNPTINATRTSNPAAIDKGALSEVMAPIMLSFHEQYKQNLEIQHENELAKEIRQMYCQVSVLRRLQAVTLSQTNGLLAASVLQLPTCSRLQGLGQSLLLQECERVQYYNYNDNDAKADYVYVYNDNNAKTDYVHNDDNADANYIYNNDDAKADYIYVYNDNNAKTDYVHNDDNTDANYIYNNDDAKADYIYVYNDNNAKTDYVHNDDNADANYIYNNDDAKADYIYVYNDNDAETDYVHNDDNTDANYIYNNDDAKADYIYVYNDNNAKTDYVHNDDNADANYIYNNDDAKADADYVYNNNA